MSAQPVTRAAERASWHRSESSKPPESGDFYTWFEQIQRSDEDLREQPRSMPGDTLEGPE